MIGRIARPGAPRPRSLLVVAPHPDDETIAAHMLMTRLRRRGVVVRVIVVSDGAASHPNSRRWPRHRLVRERRRETRHVLRRIGVDARAIAFLDLPDGRLADHANQVRRPIARAARALPAPVLALAPSPDDVHPDHRVVAGAARRQAGLDWLAYPIWPAGQRLRGARPLPLTAQQRLAKRHALRGYRTQCGCITDDPTGFAMSARQIAAFTGPQEVFAAMGGR